MSERLAEVDFLDQMIALEKDLGKELTGYPKIIPRQTRNN